MPTGRTDDTLPMMAIPPTIGVVLVLAGLALFLVDLNVTNHGLPTAGAILALLAGGLVLLGAGVPYSGVDRKSTRLNSSHANISYAVFCLKKKKIPALTVAVLSTPASAATVD